MLYGITFLLLYACYFIAAFPQGDDSSKIFQLNGYNHAVPELNGWIANRVVDSFFNQYLFLAVKPLTSIIGGSDFFVAFRVYTGALNAAIGCAIVFLMMTNVLPSRRVDAGCYLATFLGCLVLVFKIVFGDTTHAVAYGLTWVICFYMLTTLHPLQEVFAAQDRKANPEQPIYGFFIAAYFTAFGNELYALFAMAYILSIAFSHYLCQVPPKRSMVLADIHATIGRRLNSARQWAIIFLIICTTSAMLLLLNSGRANQSVVTNEELDRSSFIVYAHGFLIDLMSNPLFKIWPLFILILSVYSVHHFLGIRFTKLSTRTETAIDQLKPSEAFAPMIFFCTLNFAYLAILFVAGYRDSRSFVGVLEAPWFYTGRSQLFLAPLLTVNLAMTLRCLLTWSLQRKGVAIIYFMFSMIVFFSSSHRFLSSSRVNAQISGHIEQAFRLAENSKSDIIELPFCMPAKAMKEGYPYLPRESAWEWYRRSYNIIFRLYYNKKFSDAGPVFRPLPSCSHIIE